MACDEDLAERLRELLAGENAITEKKMFGGLAFLLHGNLAVSASRKAGYWYASIRATLRHFLRDPMWY
jgi:TfoX/Sxy family transcriptional regulator of competence genes